MNNIVFPEEIAATLKTTGSCPVGTCPDTETCCDVGGGMWGCCPYPNAQCCSDHSHCCPPNYNCDVTKGACVHTLGAMLGARQFLPMKKVNKL